MKYIRYKFTNIYYKIHFEYENKYIIKLDNGFDVANGGLVTVCKNNANWELTTEEEYIVFNILSA